MLKRIMVRVLICSTLFLASSSDLFAQRKTPVRFAKGRTSMTLSGKLVGGGYKNYVLTAKAGQFLSAILSSSSNKVNFCSGNARFGDRRMSFTTISGENEVCIENAGNQTTFKLIISIR